MVLKKFKMYDWLHKKVQSTMVSNQKKNTVLVIFMDEKRIMEEEEYMISKYLIFSYIQ